MFVNDRAASALLASDLLSVLKRLVRIRKSMPRDDVFCASSDPPLIISTRLNGGFQHEALNNSSPFRYLIKLRLIRDESTL